MHTLSSSCSSGPHQHLTSPDVTFQATSTINSMGSRARLCSEAHRSLAALPRIASSDLSLPHQALLLVLIFMSRSNDCLKLSLYLHSGVSLGLTRSFLSLVLAHLHLQSLGPHPALLLQTSVNSWLGQRPRCSPSPEGGFWLLQFARRSQQL